MIRFVLPALMLSVAGCNSGPSVYGVNTGAPIVLPNGEIANRQIYCQAIFPASGNGHTTSLGVTGPGGVGANGSIANTPVPLQKIEGNLEERDYNIFRACQAAFSPVLTPQERTEILRRVALYQAGLISNLTITDIVTPSHTAAVPPLNPDISTPKR